MKRLMQLKLVIIPTQASIHGSEQAINNVLSTKAFILSVPSLFEALVPAKAALLLKARDSCRPELIQPVTDLIASTINEDVTFAKSPLDMRHQRTYAIKVRDYF
jgi:DNA mismatch repair protein MSH4